MITVFTPTFNRKERLKILYQSLSLQSSKDFEWIVVDDGSSDETFSILSKWVINEKKFPIIAVRTKNGGKHRAMNIGVRLAKGDAFFVVDSDDELVSSAIEDVIHWLSTVSDDESIAGVSGLKGKDINSPLGGWGKFKMEYIDADLMQREKLGLTMDKAEVYKTEVLRKFPLPEFEGENFLGEVYHAEIAASGYKLRWFKKVVYLCDYYSDGLTARGNLKYLENPHGTGYLLNVLDRCYGTEVTNKTRFRWWLLFIKRYPIESVESYILNNDRNLTSTFLECKNKLINDLNIFFTKNNIKKIAIYGLGQVGEIFLTLKDELSVKIMFGIDKQIKNIPGLKTVEFTDGIPKNETVDLVLITLKSRNEELRAELNCVFKNIQFWCNISMDDWLW